LAYYFGYDPANYSWQKFTNMNRALYGASSFVFHDQLYIVGGQSSDLFFGKVQIYDTKYRQWGAGPNLLIPVAQMASTFLSDNSENGTSLSFFLGINGLIGESMVATLQVFVPEISQWFLLPELNTPGLIHSAVTQYDDKVYLIGGQYADKTYSQDTYSIHIQELKDYLHYVADLNDPAIASNDLIPVAAPSWRLLNAKLPEGISSAQAVVYNNRLLLLGGKKASGISGRIYEYTNEEWIDCNLDVDNPLKLPTDEAKHSFNALVMEQDLTIDGNVDPTPREVIYLYGGMGLTGDSEMTFRLLPEDYGLSKDYRWEVLDNMLGTRKSMTSVYYNGKAYVIGGLVGETPTNAIHTFKPPNLIPIVQAEEILP